MPADSSPSAQFVENIALRLSIQPAPELLRTRYRTFHGNLRIANTEISKLEFITRSDLANRSSIERLRRRMLQWQATIVQSKTEKLQLGARELQLRALMLQCPASFVQTVRRASFPHWEYTAALQRLRWFNQIPTSPLRVVQILGVARSFQDIALLWRLGRQPLRFK